MGYHNIVLPGEYSEGSAFGIGFDTRISTLESGQETRVVRYGVETGRRKYALNRKYMSIDMFSALYRFYINRQGATFSFKFRDPLDFASTTHGTAGWNLGPEPTEIDQPCRRLSNSQFQITKTYNDGIRTIVRTIDKPIPGTWSVSVDGILLSPGLYTVNPETGIISTSGSYPTQEIRAGYQFYTVVRFTNETDQAFRTSALATTQTVDLPSIELIEEINSAPVSQDYQYGGASPIYTLAAGMLYTLSELEGRCQTFLINGASTRLQVPSTQNLPLGGPIFVIKNSSAVYATKILDVDGTSDLVGTVAAGDVVQLFIFADATTAQRRWIAII